MNDFVLFGEIVIILCGLPEVPRFNKIILIVMYGIWTVIKIINWLADRLKEQENEYDTKTERQLWRRND